MIVGASEGVCGSAANKYVTGALAEAPSLFTTKSWNVYDKPR